MGQVQGLSLRRTEELDPSLKVTLFHVTTSDDLGYVGVRFEQQLTPGVVREFRTDLARLDFIEQRAEAYTRSQDAAERFERVGGTEVRLKRGDFPGRGEAVRVHLFEKAADGSGEWQICDLYADHLKRAVQEGQKLEKELGYDRRWHVLVDAGSLARDGAGRVYAQAVRCFESEERARAFLGKSTGLALYAEPQRREFSEGEPIELWADAHVLVRGQKDARSVGQQLGDAEWSRERQSEHYVVARWNDASSVPAVGQRVRWEGLGRTYNGEPEDFRAGPIAARDRGQTDGRQWVLIERDSLKPGQGTVRALSHDRSEMTAELTELTRREALEQAITRDWEKQSLGMRHR